MNILLIALSLSVPSQAATLAGAVPEAGRLARESRAAAQAAQRRDQERRRGRERLDAWYDGASFVVWNPRLRKEVRHYVSLPSGAHQQIAVGNSVAVLVAGDRGVGYDARRDAFTQVIMSGSRARPNRLVQTGHAVLIARGDELYVFDPLRGADIRRHTLVGSSSVESEIESGWGFAAILRYDRLYVFDDRAGQLSETVMAGSSALPNRMIVRRDVAAVVRERSDRLYVYDAERRAVLENVMSGSSSLRLDRFEVSRSGRVEVEREGRLTVYDPRSGVFTNN